MYQKDRQAGCSSNLSQGSECPDEMAFVKPKAIAIFPAPSLRLSPAHERNARDRRQAPSDRR